MRLKCTEEICERKTSIRGIVSFEDSSDVNKSISSVHSLWRYNFSSCKPLQEDQITAKHVLNVKKQRLIWFSPATLYLTKNYGNGTPVWINEFWLIRRVGKQEKAKSNFCENYRSFERNTPNLAALGHTRSIGPDPRKM